MIIRLYLAIVFSVTCGATTSLGADTSPLPFAQLGPLLDTPTEVRLASGAPGPAYWQQRADYNIAVTLDDKRQHISGEQTVTYHNNSPHDLEYIWLQLDQNRFAKHSDDVLTSTAPNFKKFPYRSMAALLARRDFNGGVKITQLRDAAGQPLAHTINKTMLRIDLPQAIAAGTSFSFSLAWQYSIADAVAMRVRSGYEFFKDDENFIYEIAQWYPRLVAYTDYAGWQHQQFLGRGEFTLELGNYEVAISVPGDHIVAATGVLQNPEEVLSATRLARYEDARSSPEPVFIVTPEEALANEKSQVSALKTWRFKADNVRDFAFASSRKFIWDAMLAPSGERQVMAMSFYPNEAEPLWSNYSSAAIAHTIDVYSRYTFDYPYPVAISVNGPVGGMEYPMISFNKPRPYKDGTYWDDTQKSGDSTWERSKYGLISVIIHEVGHNYFPMIVNSDERQWTWMDEGLNTYLQFLAEQAWEEDYPSRRGEPEDIATYMKSDGQTPIMTQSDSLLQFSNNAYAKPAAALNILRESIMGRDLFDYAFRQYARRWEFKRPTPADFFRSMEDASATDLDWFWRGWFYGTDHVDVAITDLSLYQVDTRDPAIEKPWQRAEEDKLEPSLSEQRNRESALLVDRKPSLKDFYTEFDEFTVTPYDYAEYEKLKKALSDQERVLLASDQYFYTVKFSNLGGLVTPLPLRITFADGTNQELTIPAEIWRRNSKEVNKLFVTEGEISAIELDPYRSTADTDTFNNSWPRKPRRSRFQLHKEKEGPNHMRRFEKKQWEKSGE